MMVGGSRVGPFPACPHPAQRWAVGKGGWRERRGSGKSLCTFLSSLKWRGRNEIDKTGLTKSENKGKWSKANQSSEVWQRKRCQLDFFALVALYHKEAHFFARSQGRVKGRPLKRMGCTRRLAGLLGVLTATSYQIIKGDMTSSPPNTESWLTVLKSALPFSNNVSNRHYFLLVIRSGSNSTMYRYLLEESPFFYLLFVLGNCSALWALVPCTQRKQNTYSTCPTKWFWVHDGMFQTTK